MRRIVLLAVAGSLLFSGCNWFSNLIDKDKPQQGLSYGVDADKQALLNQIERKYENPRAHYELGKLYHRDGLLDRAEWQYRVAIGFDPVLYPAQAAVVKVLKDMNNPEKSKMAAQMYTDQAAVSAEASMRLGRALQNEGLDDYALAAYQQAANLAPNSAVVFKQLGYYYMSKGDRVRAEENLRRSIQLDPYQPEVSGELGRMGVMVQIPRQQPDPQKLEKALQQP
jgi:tetratricopeptide (TPR) repeat protein